MLMVVAEVVVVAAVGLNLVVLQPTPDKISAPWLLLAGIGGGRGRMVLLLLL